MHEKEFRDEDTINLSALKLEAAVQGYGEANEGSEMANGQRRNQTIMYEACREQQNGKKET